MWLHKAFEEPENKDAPIIGYFYWTLMDNMEWDFFKPTDYGLVNVHHTTKERIPRPSAYLYRDIIKAHGVTKEMIETHVLKNKAEK